MTRDIVDGRYLEVLVRQDCPRCEAGMGVVLQAAATMGVAVHTVDVASRSDLHGQLAARTPVVRAPDGTIIDEGKLSAARITAALLQMTFASRPEIH